MGQREEYEERDGRRRETLRLGQREEYEERERWEEEEGDTEVGTEGRV